MIPDVAIVGGGPAGISAAIYLKRAGLSPLVIERDRIGGLLLNANLVENYPGFPEGISGRSLVELLKKHLDRWKVEVTRSEVRRIVPRKGVFQLDISEEEIESSAVILATGTRPREAGISGERSFLGKRIFYEIRDLPDRNGLDYLIVGGGDAAFDYAMNLSEKAGRIDIVFRPPRPNCLGLLLERTREKGNINIHPCTVPKSFGERGKRISLSCQARRKKKEFEADYALIACGREPELPVVEGLSYALTERESCETEVPGLYIAGDLRSGKHRQVGIAIGDGLRAAMFVADFLKGGEVG